MPLVETELLKAKKLKLIEIFEYLESPPAISPCSDKTALGIQDLNEALKTNPTLENQILTFMSTVEYLMRLVIDVSNNATRQDINGQFDLISKKLLLFLMKLDELNPELQHYLVTDKVARQCIYFCLMSVTFSYSEAVDVFFKLSNAFISNIDSNQPEATRMHISALEMLLFYDSDHQPGRGDNTEAWKPTYPLLKSVHFIISHENTAFENEQANIEPPSQYLSILPSFVIKFYVGCIATRVLLNSKNPQSKEFLDWYDHCIMEQIEESSGTDALQQRFINKLIELKRYLREFYYHYANSRKNIFIFSANVTVVEHFLLYHIANFLEKHTKTFQPYLYAQGWEAMGNILTIRSNNPDRVFPYLREQDLWHAISILIRQTSSYDQVMIKTLSTHISPILIGMLCHKKYEMAYAIFDDYCNVCLTPFNQNHHLTSKSSPFVLQTLFFLSLLSKASNLDQVSEALTTVSDTQRKVFFTDIKVNSQALMLSSEFRLLVAQHIQKVLLSIKTNSATEDHKEALEAMVRLVKLFKVLNVQHPSINSKKLSTHVVDVEKNLKANAARARIAAKIKKEQQIRREQQKIEEEAKKKELEKKKALQEEQKKKRQKAAAAKQQAQTKKKSKGKKKKKVKSGPVTDCNIALTQQSDVVGEASFDDVQVLETPYSEAPDASTPEVSAPDTKTVAIALDTTPSEAQTPVVAVKSQLASQTMGKEAQKLDYNGLFFRPGLEEEISLPNQVKTFLLQIMNRFDNALVLTGGAVLDILLGKKVNDYDLFLFGTTLLDLEEYLKSFSGIKLRTLIKENFQMIKVTYKGVEYDFKVSDAPYSNDLIQDILKDSDFKHTTLFVELSNNSKMKVQNREHLTMFLQGKLQMVQENPRLLFTSPNMMFRIFKMQLKYPELNLTMEERLEQTFNEYLNNWLSMVRNHHGRDFYRDRGIMRTAIFNLLSKCEPKRVTDTLIHHGILTAVSDIPADTLSDICGKLCLDEVEPDQRYGALMLELQKQKPNTPLFSRVYLTPEERYTPSCPKPFNPNYADCV